MEEWYYRRGTVGGLEEEDGWVDGLEDRACIIGVEERMDGKVNGWVLLEDGCESVSVTCRNFPRRSMTSVIIARVSGSQAWV